MIVSTRNHHGASRPGPVPARAGIGLRAQHHDQVACERPDVGWLEAHSENYFGEGGAALRSLERARADYPISLHGVGLSLGSTDPLDRGHLAQLKRLVDRIEPALVSEHISWGAAGGRHLNDLLPLPCTEEALRHLRQRIGVVQDVLGREILVENVSSYLQYRTGDMPEWEFIAAVAAESGAGLLLDINNVYVNARNLGFDPRSYLDRVPRSAVREIHLAGHERCHIAGREILIDTHGDRVCDDVWRLYAAAVERFGPLPTLIEWDTDVPALDVLVDEARRADRVMEHHDAVAA